GCRGQGWMSIDEGGTGQPDPVLTERDAVLAGARPTDRSQRQARTDLSILARGSSFVVGGNLVNGVLRLAIAVLVARGLGASGAGALWIAAAVFAILSQIAELGADTGLVRM